MFAPQKLETEITQDHTVIIQFPETVPVGTRVRVVVEAIEDTAPAPTTINPAREAMRAKLESAGLLSSAKGLSPDTRIPTKEEVLAAGALPPSARSTEEILDEIRGEW